MWELAAKAVFAIVTFVFGKIEKNEAEQKAYNAFIETMSGRFSAMAKQYKDYKTQLEELKNGKDNNPK